MVLVLAFLSALSQDPPPREKPTVIQGLSIPVPSTWTRKDEGTVTYLIPPQIQSSLPYLLAVFPSNNLHNGAHWEAHRAMVKNLVAQAQWPGKPVLVEKLEGPGIFIKTEASGRTSDGQGRQFTLFTAVHDGTMEAIFAVNALDRNVVDPVLQATTFKDPPKQTSRPKIREAWRRTDQKLYINPSGGAMIPGSLQYERLWILEDNIADFSTYYFEGYAASPLPLKADATFLNGDFGSWKSLGGKIHVLRSSGGTPIVYELDGAALKGDGKTWEPMPRVDGLKLSGRWEIKSPGGHDWIEFTPEGRFKVEGLLKSVAFGDGNPVRPPDKGAGTYEIRDWTMFFKFDDGTSWSTDFSTLGREIGPDTPILFRTKVYSKAK
jgi:hypothetical protein